MKANTNPEIENRSLGQFVQQLRRFAAERDWGQYHTPRALAVSIAVETGELLEHVQWRTEDQVHDYLEDTGKRQGMADEVADVLIYGLMLADSLGYEPLELLYSKLEKNREKYPETAANTLE